MATDGTPAAACGSPSGGLGPAQINAWLADLPLAEAAARDQMSYRGFLAELLMAECDDRARRR